MNVLIRRMKQNEASLLEDFLYEAIFVPENMSAPPRSILATPALQVYIENFGDSPDDLAFVAEVEGRVVGAVWVRIMEDYGHIDDQTPSFAISLYSEYRGQGIGTQLMDRMLCELKHKGYVVASLAVQKQNDAYRLYRRLGFTIVNENSEEYIMKIDLQAYKEKE